MSFNTIPAILGGRVAPAAPSFGVTSWVLPTAVGDAFGTLANSWTNPNNTLVEDDTVATRAFAASGVSSFTWKTFNFAGLVPAGAIVYGYDYQIRWSSTRTDTDIFGANIRADTGGGSGISVCPFGNGTGSASNTLVTQEFGVGNRFVSWFADAADPIGDLTAGDDAEFTIHFGQPGSGSSTISIAWIKMRLKYIVPVAGNKLTWANSFGSTGANVDNAGGLAWTNPGNATANDGTTALLDLAKGQQGDWLRVTGFSYSIPADAIPVAIMVELDLVSFDDDISDEIQVYDGANVYTVPRPGPTLIEESTSIESWRQTDAGAGEWSGICARGTVDSAHMANFTAAVINGSSWGAQFSPFGQSSLANPSSSEVDYLKTRVLYVESI